MRKELADFQNRDIYRGKLKNAVSTNGLAITPTFDRAFCVWVKENYPDFLIEGLSRHLLAIDVPGECIIDETSHPRYNELNVDAMVSLVEAVLKEGPDGQWLSSCRTPRNGYTTSENSMIFWSAGSHL